MDFVFDLEAETLQARVHAQLNPPCACVVWCVRMCFFASHTFAPM